MRFALDDDREALRSTARDLLAELCPPAVVRAAWTQAPDRAPWDALADAGALGVLVKESEGGLGLDETYLVGVVEEAGRAALPHPLTATALVAAPLGVTGPMVTTDLGAVDPMVTTDLGAVDPAVTEDLGAVDPAVTEDLGAVDPAVTEDLGAVDPAVTEDLGAVDPAVTEDLGAVDPAVTEDLGAVDPAVTAEAGRARPVVASAAFAEAFLLRSDDGLRLYEPDELEIEPVETVDASRHCARVRPRGRGDLVTDDAVAVAAAFERGVLGSAAELLGLSRAMLELTVGYAAQRHQFGKPIGSFQAVKHHLANARIQIEFAGPAVLYAAYGLAHGLTDTSRSVSQAKWLATNAAAVTGRAALQCHGAIGYTTEYDLHLYLKRSWALARSWGGADYHADRVAASIGI